jgi:predicted PurR-regulated permease PerM
MEEEYVKRTGFIIILCLLLVLCFFLLKPILIPIILGMLLAFIFSPVYDRLNKKTKSKNFSAAIICFLVALLFASCIWFFTPIAIEQSMKIYTGAQQMNFATILKKISPSFFASEQFANEIGSIIQSFITRSVNSLSTSLSDILLHFPALLLQAFVVILTFFYLLRVKEEIGAYIKSISPFSKEIDMKFFEYSKGITSSVLYGFVIVGILQGIIVGISLFLFNVPNALLLTLLSIVVSIIPILGPFLIWVPVAIYLFMAQNVFQALGVSVFGIIASSVDNILRPLIVSRRTSLPTSLVFLGMIGGFFFFGILGFILGPLIIAYLLIFLEIYRSKKFAN